MTIGDVMAVVGIILGICLSLWVLLIGAALLFEERARRARMVWEGEAKRALALGVFLFAVLGVGGIALLNAPGVLKLLGWVFVLAFLALSLLGGAGLALLLGERTGARDERISSLTALARGAGMMALGWLFPVLGWFLVAPVCVIIGAGAGAKALRGRKVREVKEAGLRLAAQATDGLESWGQASVPAWREAPLEKSAAPTGGTEAAPHDSHQRPTEGMSQPQTHPCNSPDVMR